MKVLLLVLAGCLLIASSTTNAAQLKYTLNQRSSAEALLTQTVVSKRLPPISRNTAVEYLISGLYDGRINVYENLLEPQLKFSFDDSNGGHQDGQEVRFLVALSKNDRFASYSYDDTLKIWDLAQGKLVRTIDLSGEGKKVTVRKAVEVKDGNLIALGLSNGKIRVYDLTTFELKFTFDSPIGGHTEQINDLTELQNGFLASASDDDTIRVWNLATVSLVYTFDRSNNGHKNDVEVLQVLDNGYLASGDRDGVIKVIDLTGTQASGFRVLETFTSKNGTHDGKISLFALLENGFLASAADDDNIKVWDLTVNKLKFTLKGHKSAINALIGLDDGLLASGSNDNSIIVWDITNGKLKDTFAKRDGHKNSVEALAVLRNGNLLASASRDQTVKVWSLDFDEEDKKSQ